MTTPTRDMSGKPSTAKNLQPRRLCGEQFFFVAWVRLSVEAIELALTVLIVRTDSGRLATLEADNLVSADSFTTKSDRYF